MIQEGPWLVRLRGSFCTHAPPIRVGGVIPAVMEGGSNENKASKASTYSTSSIPTYVPEDQVFSEYQESPPDCTSDGL